MVKEASAMANSTRHKDISTILLNSGSASAALRRGRKGGDGEILHELTEDLP
jgi:hypothetical protein